MYIHVATEIHVSGSGPGEPECLHAEAHSSKQGMRNATEVPVSESKIGGTREGLPSSPPPGRPLL